MKFKFEIKNKKALKVGLITSAAWLGVVGGMLAVYLNNPNRKWLYIEPNDYTTITVAAENIKKGEVISELNIIQKTVNSEYVGNAATVDFNAALGKKALTDFVVGESIYSKDLLDINTEYDKMIPFPVEVGVFSTIANMVEIGDYVDINVTNGKIDELTERLLYNPEGEIIYSNSFFRVSPKKRIEDLRTSEGKSITEVKEEVLPKYAIIYFTETELNEYLEARNIGTMFLGLYKNSTEEAREKTYFYNQIVFPKKQEQAGGTDE